MISWIHCIKNFAFGILFMAATFGGLALPCVVQGQTQAELVEQNQAAMEAYANLDIDRAKSILDTALLNIERRNLSGPAVARTHLNMGIIAIGGFSDNAKGLEHFEQALKQDRTIALDPLYNTPNVQTVFAMAQRKLGIDPGQASSSQTSSAQQPTQAPPAGENKFEHESIPEQLVQTPLPVFLKGKGATRVYLFYKNEAMQQYRRLQMRALRDGYGAEIPCADVNAPSINYYLIVEGEAGAEPAQRFGNADAPLIVPVVSTRTHAAPFLPGLPVPEQCTFEECPPGMQCANGRPLHSLGGSCTTDAQCVSGLSCEENICIETASNSNEAPRFFFNAGIGFGIGFVTKGMTADRVPDPVPTTQDELRLSPFIPASTDTMRTECKPSADQTQWCVRVESEGVLAATAVHLAIGYYVLEKLGFALTFRWQPDSGVGDFSSFKLGGRVQVLLTDPSTTGWNIHAHLGYSVGQIQYRPPGNGEKATSPFIVSGLSGIPFGTILGYRFHPNFGLYAAPEAIFQLPNSLFVIDLSVGASVSF